MKKDMKQPTKKSKSPKGEAWTIITAMDAVLKQAEDSTLSDSFWKKSKEPLAFLRAELGLTDFQILVVAMLLESGKTMNWYDFGKFLKCTRLSIMIYADEVEQLIEKRWCCKKIPHYTNYYCDIEDFALMDGVATALGYNQAFVPEKIDGLSIQEFVDKMERRLDKTLHRHDPNFEEEEKWLLMLCKANPQLPLCREVMRFTDIHVQALMLLIVYDFAQWAESNYEGLTMELINGTFPAEYETDDMRKKLQDGIHPLMLEGLIEHKCDDGVADDDRYMLTRRSKEELLEDYTPSKSKCHLHRRELKSLMKCDTIKEKPMFYNTTEQNQIETLTKLLSQDSLPKIQERLSNEGMRKGFACLFYGEPGTGKTETVLQLARQTGRDIMQIDIAGMRDKYVGETEKNIKGVFVRYQRICEQSEVTPILFFNEADGIFGKRTNIGGINPSVEKMDNAMQNIILQEMENLNGILIATTNLTQNLDDAFERRFLFKVEFHKPDTDVKTKLWKSMLGDDITEADASTLAGRYEFSGGQIENIARKRSIDYVLYGKRCTLETLDTYCRNELLAKKKAHAPVGFRI